MQAFFSFNSLLSALVARFLDSKIETLGEQLYFLDLNSGLITFCCGWLTPVYFLVESKFCYLQFVWYMLSSVVKERFVFGCQF